MLEYIKLSFITELEDKISLPKNYFQKDEDSITIRYNLCNSLRIIYLKGRSTVVAYLEDNGIANYIKTCIQIADHSGRVVLLQKITPMRWEDIDISPAIAQMLAARNEFLSKGKITGIALRKIKQLFKAA